MSQPPDDERDDGEPDDDELAFELSDAARERLREAFAPVAQEIGKQFAEAVSPWTDELTAQLNQALAPYAERMRKQWVDVFSGIDLRPLLPTFELPADLVETLKRWREFIPPNWPRGVDVDRMTTAIADDGIPLVWAPRAEVVAEALAASDRAARVAALVARQELVIEDCRAVLADMNSPAYEGKVLLARQALDALEAGHHEAAQALAVVVAESAVASAIHPTYDKVKRKVLVSDLDKVRIADLRLRAALAPLHRFYTEWTEGKTPGPMPVALSRHVTVHSAAPQHFTEGNALLAVLLTSTTLRALQELEEIRTTLGDPTWLPK